MATSASSLGLRADRTPLMTPARNAAGPLPLAETYPFSLGRPEPVTHCNQPNSRTWPAQRHLDAAFRRGPPGSSFIGSCFKSSS